MPPKTAPHLLYGAQDQRVRPEHDCNTCWSTIAPIGDRQTTKVGLIWTRHQTRLAVQDCSPWHARVRSTRRGREKKRWMDNVKEFVW
ncbi:hypothetical protein DPMN_178643 [Dreissena polymorpha]|uniref:Uncharacterized protein n=1 Tax=Dreissena polymorpha TaxID=45954 RepID=A0A9D4ED87_DREPO|nr:hypothetical protein DPMN_178643 [Dreissena polymorpha]